MILTLITSGYKILISFELQTEKKNPKTFKMFVLNRTQDCWHAHDLTEDFDI